MNRSTKNLLIIIIIMITGIPTSGRCQENFIVRDLEIDGNRVLSDGALKGMMTTYATSFFKQFILRKDPYRYSEEILRSDLRSIVRRYNQEGFLYARADLANLELDSEDRTLGIVIRVDEGDSITIRNIEFSLQDSSSQNYTEVDSIFGELRPKLREEERRFRDDEIKSDRQAILSALEEGGFPYAEVQSELNVNEDMRTVDIDWEVKTGPVCSFSNIEIKGNRYANDKLIRDALTLEPGKRYNSRDLHRSQRRIYNLGTFQTVTVTARLTSAGDTTVPVEVRVNEAPRFSTKLGLGYGREEKIRVSSDSRLLGVLGQARQINLILKHSDLEPYHASLKLTRPAFITYSTNLELKTYILRQEERAFIVNRYGGDISILQEFYDYLHGSVTYNFERVNLDTTSVALVDSQPDVRDLYNKSSVQFGLVWDNSRPMFSPDGGISAALTFKVSGLDLGSDYHYTRMLVDSRHYQSILGMVLAGKLKLGGIKSTDAGKFVPVEDRFYSGGSSSVRGWARFELGPKVDDKPVGGKSLLESSVELRFPIVWRISGVVFYDFGNVWLSSYSYHLDDLRYSAGAGLRFRTPIGPVRFDVAQPVFDPEKTVQFHLSVGQAF
jgi:outer membrane protein insertion porin family